MEHGGSGTLRVLLCGASQNDPTTSNRYVQSVLRRRQSIIFDSENVLVFIVVACCGIMVLRYDDSTLLRYLGVLRTTLYSEQYREPISHGCSCRA